MEVLTAECEAHELLMSEIQIRNIVDRAAINASQGGTDGASTMKQGEKTISKFSKQALVLGDHVSPRLQQKIHRIYDEHAGDDKVFPLSNGPPKMLEMYKNKPYNYELREEFRNGSLPLPSVKAFDWESKPATAKIIRDFIKSTPVVSPCANPRCISRLVIVPKLDPGQSKDSKEHGFRVTVNALFNKCLKPAASTIPLATAEIKKLHGMNYYLQIDGLSAFWSIPVGEESRRLTAFHTPDGIYCWDRLLMGARPSSAVQQAAYLKALDDHIDSTYRELYPNTNDRCGLGHSIRHRYASYCDDLAAGAETLDQLYILFQVLIIACAKSGIQVKASKAKFGVEEITFHNYLINSTTTRPKQANLCPIRNMGIPRDVHQVKAFLGMCQQLSQYVEKYSIIAQPLHALTKSDGTNFPKPWLAGSPPDIAFHRLKAAMLDPSNFLWHKVKTKRLFIECDASDLGYGAAAYQYEHDIDAKGDDEGVARLGTKAPKRIIEWMSKAWTTDQLKLPVFYRESLARLIVLEKFRNLIESNIDSGTTVYTDHLPSLFKSSLSNKGQLSEWRINEVQDLNSIVQTLYKKGPTMIISDALSRCCQPETDLYDNDLPRKLAVLLDRLPARIKEAHTLRVHAHKDTAAAGRIVQRWRTGKNPVSALAPTSSAKSDFTIAFPLDKGTMNARLLLERKQPFALLLPVSTLNRIAQDVKTRAIVPEIDTMVAECTKIVISALNLCWLVYLGPDDNGRNMTTEVLNAEAINCPLETQLLPLIKEENHNWEFGCSESEAHEIMNACIATTICLPMTRAAAAADKPQRGRPLGSKTKRSRPIDLKTQSKRTSPRLNPSAAAPTTRQPRKSILRKNKKNGPGAQQPNRKPKSISTKMPSTKKNGPGLSEIPNKATDSQLAPPTQQKKGPGQSQQPTTMSFNEEAPPPTLIPTWVGRQLLGQSIPDHQMNRYIKQIPNQPDGLCGFLGDHGQPRIIVPLDQQKRLLLQTHVDLLHQDASRVYQVLRTLYYWPGMKQSALDFIPKCSTCQKNKMKRQHLKSKFMRRSAENLPLPRQAYGFDFYGVPKGEILVITDLCTREVTFAFTKTREQKSVAQALLNHIVFLKGVPVSLRSDSAPELVKGVVGEINKYLGIKQIQTGGYNPRGNAICERVNQTLGAMLRKCSDKHYNNLHNYLPAIAFAINCTHSNALNCTPFEAGHGLPARTIAQARAHASRAPFTAGGTDNTLQDVSKRFDNSLQKDILELATQMCQAAQSESEYQRRLTSDRLNQAGKTISTKAFSTGEKVYYYKPSQPRPGPSHRPQSKALSTLPRPGCRHPKPGKQRLRHQA